MAINNNYYCHLQVSILHPLATLDWEDCTPLPEPISDPQCVLLHDVLYVGGGAKLFMSNTVTKRLVWDVCHTPIKRYALTTYHSQLVLVGGMEPYTGEISNMLWTLSSDSGMNWQPSIQEMPTKRWAASAMNTGTPEYLVVAGGKGDDDSELDTVEVFTGKVWITIEPLPKPCYYLKWALHKGRYYLFSGYLQGTAMYSCDVKLLIKSCGVNMRPFHLWRQSQVPLEYCSIASFGQHLISIGGIDPKFMSHKSPLIFALSTWSWVQVGKFPIPLDSATSIVLPTGELVVIGGDTGGLSYSPRMFKAKLTGEDIACGYEASEDNVQLQYIRMMFSGWHSYCLSSVPTCQGLFL